MSTRQTAYLPAALVLLEHLHASSGGRQIDLTYIKLVGWALASLVAECRLSAVGAQSQRSSTVVADLAVATVARKAASLYQCKRDERNADPLNPM
jgi:hypothetical protein